MDLKRELVIPNDDLPFKMFVFEGKNGNYRVTKHWHDTVEIFVVFEGEIDFYINSSYYGLSKGKFIIVNSNEVHSIDVPKENFTIVVQIPQEEFERFKKDEYMLFGHTPVGYKEQDAQFVRLIRQMYTAYAEKTYGYELEVLSDYYKMMHLLITRYRDENVDEERRKRRPADGETVQDYVLYTGPLSRGCDIGTCSRNFGFSPTYLSRIFKRYANVNYKTYVLNESGVRL